MWLLKHLQRQKCFTIHLRVLRVRIWLTNPGTSLMGLHIAGPFQPNQCSAISTRHSIVTTKLDARGQKIGEKLNSQWSISYKQTLRQKDKAVQCQVLWGLAWWNDATPCYKNCHQPLYTLNTMNTKITAHKSPAKYLYRLWKSVGGVGAKMKLCVAVRD